MRKGSHTAETIHLFELSVTIELFVPCGGGGVVISVGMVVAVGVVISMVVISSVVTVSTQKTSYYTLRGGGRGEGARLCRESLKKIT